MDVKFSVIWTLESKNKVDKIVQYLQENWGNVEAEKFLDLLQQFEKTISTNPLSYESSSKYLHCRLGLVHKHVTAIYKVVNNSIVILTVIDNRSHIDK